MILLEVMVLGNLALVAAYTFDTIKEIRAKG